MDLVLGENTCPMPAAKKVTCPPNNFAPKPVHAASTEAQIAKASAKLTGFVICFMYNVSLAEFCNRLFVST